MLALISKGDARGIPLPGHRSCWWARAQGRAIGSTSRQHASEPDAEAGHGADRPPVLQVLVLLLEALIGFPAHALRLLAIACWHVEAGCAEGRIMKWPSAVLLAHGLGTAGLTVVEGQVAAGLRARAGLHALQCRCSDTHRGAAGQPA